MGDLVTLVLLPMPVLAAVLLYLDIRRKRRTPTAKPCRPSCAVRTAT